MPEPILDPKVHDLVTDRHRHLRDRGELLSQSTLDACYKRFRERFGPEQLSELDGVSLLEMMHLHGNRDSLVYWLEFKNDEEMPAGFGSIAGGSAFKFGLYYSAEADSWVTGSAKNTTYLSVEEAVQLARSHRDQLLAGAELLQALPQEADDPAYARLEQELAEKAPDVADKAWGHKYLSLLFPDKLDDYHAGYWQRYILARSLQVPPEGEGRYVCAGRFMAICRELNIPMNQLSSTLNDLFGSPYAYWLLATTKEELGRVGPSGRVALDWTRLGDLGNLTYSRDSKNRLRDLVSQHYPEVDNAAAATQDIFYFCVKMQERDLVIAHDDGRVHAIGRVREPYTYESAGPLPHQREVEWLSFDEWNLPQDQVPSRQFTDTKSYRLHTQIERKIFGNEPRAWSQGDTTLPPEPPSLVLTGIPHRIAQVLERKGQVVLYGPPGTGKTYWAERTAKDIASLASFQTRYENLTEGQDKQVFGDPSSMVRQCTFHPAYGYEDFIEGYRPATQDGQLVFELTHGLFRKLCEDARSAPERNYYLIIDEINRGDIPRIFGELLTVLEMTKRGTPVTLPVTGDQLVVPQNVFVIGTMNTADRSIALLDTALRRRFGFIELMPDASVLGKTAVGGIPLEPWLSSLNDRLRENLGRDARNLQVGHSYLMRNGRPLQSFTELKRAVREDLIPLLQEYCYDDWDALVRILGSGLVDGKTQRIRDELFEDAREADLVHALIQPSPDISTSFEAAEAEAETEEVEEEDEIGDEGASDNGQETTPPE